MIDFNDFTKLELDMLEIWDSPDRNPTFDVDNKVLISAKLLQFAGATGYGFDIDGDVDFVTPDTITLEAAHEKFKTFPRFRGLPYPNGAMLDRAVGGILQSEFKIHFGAPQQEYMDVFSKVMTKKLEGDTSIDWDGWVAKRQAILDAKDEYVLAVMELGLWQQ